MADADARSFDARDDVNVRLIGTNAWVIVKGDLDLAGLACLENTLLDADHPPITAAEIDLSECDADEAEVLVETINTLRRLLKAGIALTLIESPQLLAHDLYRVGMLLPGSRLRLIDPRVEIGNG